MKRIIVGSIIALFGLVLDIGTIITCINKNKFTSDDILGLIISTIMIIVGAVLVHFGIRFIINRKRFLVLILKMLRENGVINANEILQYKGASEIMLRQCIDYGRIKGWITENASELFGV